MVERSRYLGEVAGSNPSPAYRLPPKAGQFLNFMGRKPIIRTVFVAVLCLVSYLTIEMPWRFEVVDADLAHLQDLSSGKSGWGKSRAGVSIKTEPSGEVVCLKAGGGGELASITKKMRLASDVGHVRISVEAKFEGIIPGPESWHQGNLLFWSFDLERNFGLGPCRWLEF